MTNENVTLDALATAVAKHIQEMINKQDEPDEHTGTCVELTVRSNDATAAREVHEHCLKFLKKKGYLKASELET